MRRGWLTLLAVITCGLLIYGAATVFAQDAPGGIPSLEGPGGGEETPAAEEGGGEPAAEETGGAGAETPEEPEEEAAVGEQRGMSVFRLVLEHGGWVGYIIIAMSVVALYLASRMFFRLRRSELMPEQLVIALEDDLDEMRLREAMRKCMADESVLARVMRSGLREVRAGYDGMMEAMEETGEAESIRLHQHVGWLSIIGAIAPMLGLTGTVLGMMAAFSTISQMETQPPPRVLAGNIQQALVTTCMGLIVAVPVLLFYAVFRNRVTALMLDLGVAADDLLSRFKSVETTPAMVAEVREAAQAGMPEETAPAEEEPSPAGEMGEDDEVPPPPPPPE